MVEPCLEPGHDLIRGEMFSPSTGRGALERPSHLRPPQDSTAVTGTPRALARRFKIERDAFLRMLGLARPSRLRPSLVATRCLALVGRRYVFEHSRDDEEAGPCPCSQAGASPLWMAGCYVAGHGAVNRWRAVPRKRRRIGLVAIGPMTSATLY
jgi:hypothetical protein